MKQLLIKRERVVDKGKKSMYEMIDKRSYDCVFKSLEHMIQHVKSMVNETNTRM